MEAAALCGNLLNTSLDTCKCEGTLLAAQAYFWIRPAPFGGTAPRSAGTQGQNRPRVWVQGPLESGRALAWGAALHWVVLLLPSAASINADVAECYLLAI